MFRILFVKLIIRFIRTARWIRIARITSRLFNVLTWSLIRISSRIDVIKSIIQESIESFTVFVMKNCWTLILLTVLITLTVRLTVRLIIVINELAVLIIAIFFLLFKSFFECSHNIHFLNDWIRIHSCFFSSEHSFKFFKLENIVIVSTILDLFHKSRDSNIVFEWEFFD